MNISTEPWVWIGALLSIAIFSFLYRDNWLYRVAENIFVGVGNGYFISLIYSNVLIPDIYKPLKEATAKAATEGWSWSLFNPAQYANFLVIIPTIIGAMYITRFIPRISWMVRIPIAILMGYASAAAIPATMEATVLKQLANTILRRGDFVGLESTIGTIVIFLGTFCTLYFFYFSRKDTGINKHVANIGVFFMMIGFGASFGLTVMGRVSLAIGRIIFLLKDWLGLVQ
jgi:hypothetical protein